MTIIEFKALGIQREVPDANHNIAAFFHSRGIIPEAFAEFSGIPLEDLNKILKPGSDPLISQIVAVHQALNQLTYCPLEELLNTEEYIFPSAQDKVTLAKIFDVIIKIRELALPVNLDSPMFTEHDDVELHGDISISSFTNKIITHLDDMLNSSVPNFPPINSKGPAFIDPEKHGPFNCIYDEMQKYGQREFKALLSKLQGSNPSESGKIKANDAHTDLAKKILKPNHDFKLSEIKEIRAIFFKSNEDETLRFSDLIVSPVKENKLEMESLTAFFMTKFIILSQLCKGLTECDELKPEVYKEYKEEINRLMASIVPNWADNIAVSSYTKKRAAETGESLRSSSPTIDDRYFDS